MLDQAIFLVCLSAVMIIVYFGIRISEKLIPTEVPRDDEPDGSNAGPFKTSGSNCSVLIAIMKDELRTNRNRDRVDAKGKTCRETITITIIAGTLFAVSWQVFEMIKVFGPIRLQADVAADSQRAWIGPMIRASGPLTLEPDGIFTTVQVQLRNTGATPGTHVVIWLILYPTDEMNNVYHPLPREPFCKGVGLDSLHQTVFPGDPSTTTHIIHTDKWRGNSQGPLPLTKPFYVAVSGCIRYESGTTGRKHCEGIAGVLTKANDNGFPFEFVINDAARSVSGFGYSASPFGGYSDNCNADQK